MRPAAWEMDDGPAVGTYEDVGASELGTDVMMQGVHHQHCFWVAGLQEAASAGDRRSQ